ncbi:hypothetical protein GCM10010329_40380 [Streptomyces spiroverticillatus]|uniref:Uncharacterized protein n=1 Tax=Streptomyces finlayi TaxID=67296 RepID=A0A918WZB4_9ACTN|nr:hypothetical protein [Streptomyces finlayi]GHA13473.1 hypothetical protein GCM10010329_40380 [Streptomyces spiroverticillatus]GHC97924.1 hypothetical protein GCM10010334_39860 [Streptomyces finlayi]
MALLAVLLPIFMLGAILALGAYEDVLLPPPPAGPEREPMSLDVIPGGKA